MDDGNLHKSGKIRFSTNEFTLDEHRLMIDILDRKFGLKASVHKHRIGKDGLQQYNLCILKDSATILKEMVKPYIHPIFMYKIGL